MKNLSFDFDGTLSRKDVQTFAKSLSDLGFNIWIVTSRLKESWNSDLYEVAQELYIPLERIVFTNMEFKYNFFIFNPNYLFHLDDDWIELKEIDIHTSVIGIPVNGGYDWKNRILNLIENEGQYS